jgi:signal transduction histidine kinase
MQSPPESTFDENAAEPGAVAPVPAAPPPRSRRAGGFLGGMRVRKKVLFLHTVFSLGLAAILLVPLRPAIIDVVEQAEVNEARVVLRLVLSQSAARPNSPQANGEPLAAWAQAVPDGRVRAGSADALGLPASIAAQARASPGKPIAASVNGQEATAAAYVPDAGEGTFWVVNVRIPEARRAVVTLYALTAIALLAIYALVAAALELYVLPQHVYGPIDRMLDADAAVQEGNKDSEIIPDAVIPADELGEIMRSRNRSIVALRRHEEALAEALAELERVASDLKRKNHLLEAAQRNLADADRLASLGMMSAGIAHELNTPLAVVKGLAEKLNSDVDKRLDAPQAALMLRVVRRLERLGESLLDFARVRPPQTAPTSLHAVVEEAVTLVRLDRGAREVEIINRMPATLVVDCDGDRMVQVLVNILRNAVDAVRSGAAERGRDALTRQAEPLDVDGSEGRITVDSDVAMREGREWASITVTDTGPGIDVELLSRLFEPFASTRLDAHGTGLGLAVAEGIVREHGGLILARNRQDRSGAVFEIMLPVRSPGYADERPAAGGDAHGVDGTVTDPAAAAG